VGGVALPPARARGQHLRQRGRLDADLVRQGASLAAARTPPHTPAPRSALANGFLNFYGADARTTGSGFLAAFRTLANEWPLSSPLTAAESSAIDAAVTQISQAQLGVNALSSENGANIKRLADLDVLANRRTETLNQIVSNFEDANIPEVASKISQQKSLLESSYALFSQLSGLSLVNYLRN